MYIKTLTTHTTHCRPAQPYLQCSQLAVIISIKDLLTFLLTSGSS